METIDSDGCRLEFSTILTDGRQKIAYSLLYDEERTLLCATPFPRYVENRYIFDEPTLSQLGDLLISWKWHLQRRRTKPSHENQDGPRLQINESLTTFHFLSLLS